MATNGWWFSTALLDLSSNPCEQLLFITMPDGRRVTYRYFADKFREHIRQLGPEFADLYFHGLRKTTAVAIVEAGGTENELQAICGWRTQQMATHYTRMANQKKQARSAIDKIDRAENKAGRKSGNTKD